MLSIAHYASKSSGTLGCLVHSKDNPDDIFILSAFHILSNKGLEKKGDAILQPSPVDGGKYPDDIVATLENWIPLDFTGNYLNIGDAAIARITTPSDFMFQVLSDYPVQFPKAIRNPEIGMKIQKRGRTSGYTESVIKDVNFRSSLSYPSSEDGISIAGFRDQVLCERFTDAGDSGSLILDCEGYAVGLHFAGSSSSSIFSPISPILDFLNVKLVTDVEQVPRGKDYSVVILPKPKDWVHDVNFISETLMKYVKYNSEALYEIKPEAFEKLVLELFAEKGYDVQWVGRRKDIGADGIVIGSLPDGIKVPFLVEVKRWKKSRPVGIEVADLLRGAMDRFGEQKEIGRPGGIIVTTSSFTSGVREAYGNLWNFQLRDFEALVEWLNTYEPVSSLHLERRKKIIIP